MTTAFQSTLDPEDRLEALRNGGKRAMAVAIAQLEAAFDRDDTQALLEASFCNARAHVLGITGPPGVGKSTLISALIRQLRVRNKTVGVVAVDPSSGRTGGALLGDRMRFDLDPNDQGVFVRSMAARSHLGGLATLTRGAVVVMRAAYDVVVVETVGVGQSETEVATIADTVVLCIQPGSGDSVQYMKSGIAEIPDIVVVNKADLGVLADKAKADIEAALSFGSMTNRDWETQVLMVSGATGAGIEHLIAALDGHFETLTAHGRLERRRLQQATTWVRMDVLDEFGRRGLVRALHLPGGIEIGGGQSPFSRVRALNGILSHQA